MNELLQMFSLVSMTNDKRKDGGKMKRVIANLLAVAMVFSLTACAGDKNKDNSDNQNTGRDASFTVLIGDSYTWTPFETDGDVSFSNSNNNVISISEGGQTVTFLGLSVGESIITAEKDGTKKTALVKVVSDVVSNAVNNGTTAEYIDILIADMDGLNNDARMEYLLSIGDYMALSAASGETGSGFMNMAQAATLLYPCGYMLNNYATLLMQRGEYEEAALWLEKAVEAEKGNPTILTNLAECKYQLGDYAAAMDLAGKAIQSEENYGLAYLIMTCVHLKNGNDLLAIETLFKSYRSTWTETSSNLSTDLAVKMKQAADKGEMILTDFHIELLYEAVSAGTNPDGRDIPANQISLPYPVNPADCLTGNDSWMAAREAIQTENDKLWRDYSDYSRGKNGNDVRQAFCATFLAIYYEYQIEEASNNKAFKELAEELESDFWKFHNEKLDTVHSYLNELYDEVIASRDGSRYAPYMVTEAETYVDAYIEIQFKWEQYLVSLTNARRDAYEKEMRPLLEEYYLKMNAMLGYVSDADVRLGYESRAVYHINKHALINTLYNAGYETDYANRYRKLANEWREKLQQALDNLVHQREAQIQANKTENGQLKDFVEKEKGFDTSVMVTLPVGIGVSVSFGFENGVLKAGYGAYGHEIMHGYDPFTGNRSETIITRTSVVPEGLNELSATISDIKEVIDAGDITDYLKGKINPIGSIPSFDRTKGEGKTYSFNSKGEQFDVTTIKEDRTSVSWGPIGAGVSTTTTRNGYLSSSTAVKGDISFGFISIGN